MSTDPASGRLGKQRRRFAELRLGFAALLVVVAAAWPISNARAGNRRSEKGGNSLNDPAARAKAVILVKLANQKLVGGFYVEALALFKRAFRIYPSPKLHYNLARTYSELGRSMQALYHYERFLARLGRRANRNRYNIAHRQIFKLQGLIASVRLQVNIPGATVTLDGRRVGQTPIDRHVRLTPGRHVLVVAKKGYERQVVHFQSKAGQSLTRRLKLLTEKQALEKRRLVKELQARRLADRLRLARERREARLRRQRLRRSLLISGWTSVGLGVLAGGVAALMGGLFEREARILGAAQDVRWTDGYDGRLTRANGLRLGFYISLGVSAVLLTAGTALVVVGAKTRMPTETAAPPNKPPRVQILPQIGPTGAGATLTLTF